MASTRDIEAQVQELLSALPASLPPLDPPRSLSADKVASLIDHTLLAPSATTQDIEALAKEATDLGSATICVNSSVVRAAAQALSSLSSGVLPICTVGFPFGAGNTAGKVAETRAAIQDGAKEVDMVQNVGLVRQGRWADVYADVRAVVEAAQGVPVKVILETCLLNRSQLAASSLISCLAGAAFVKTSTGYSTGGAQADDIRLMAWIAHPRGVKVKASGGIRSFDKVKEMYESGADRIGASGTRAILAEAMGGGKATAADGAASY